MPKCIRCDKELVRQVAPVEGVYADEKYTVRTDALVCPAKHYATVPAEHLDEYYRLVADAYRRAHGLLTSMQIRSCRLKMNMSQQQFADFVVVGVASVKRWELGKVQDKGNDELIRLKTDFEYASKNQVGILLNQGWPADEYSGFREFSAKRFENATVFYVDRLGKVARKPKEFHMALLANKFLWFSDIEHYRHYGEGITGLRYARIDRGPVPEDYKLLYRLLQQEKVIDYRERETLIPLQPFSPKAFTREELEVLDHTWEKYSTRLGDVEDISHAERACRMAPMYQLISFKNVSGMKV